MSTSTDRPTAPRPHVGAKRRGRAHELAGKAVREAPQWRLVHGSIRGRAGERIPHASLTLDGGVFDPVIGDMFDAEIYGRRFAPEAHAEYSGRDADERIRTSGRWGPWHVGTT